MGRSNVLPAGGSLNVGDSLVSPNGQYSVIQQADGNLVLYRDEDGQALWASGQAQRPVTNTVMQGDGNMVSYSSDGKPFWASCTNGHEGARAVLQDDGNFVVYDPADNPLWASRTDQPLSPTIHSTDSRGFTYTENSPWWKEMCTVFPCCTALCWPGYATRVWDATIDGQAVVIQAWKGWCPKFLGMFTSDFPGGVGLEVGVYRRMPGRQRPTSLPFLPPPFAAFLLGAIAAAAEDGLWWPIPNHDWSLGASFVNPITGKTVFEASPEKTWWLTKWMNDDSHYRYETQECQYPWLTPWFPGNRRTPFPADGYTLNFTVNGIPFTW